VFTVSAAIPLLYKTIKYRLYGYVMLQKRTSTHTFVQQRTRLWKSESTFWL